MFTVIGYTLNQNVMSGAACGSWCELRHLDFDKLVHLHARKVQGRHELEFARAHINDKSTDTEYLVIVRLVCQGAEGRAVVLQGATCMLERVDCLDETLCLSRHKRRVTGAVEQVTIGASLQQSLHRAR